MKEKMTIVNDVKTFCKASSWKRVREEKDRRQKIFLATYDLEMYPPLNTKLPSMGGNVVIVAKHKYDFLVGTVKTLLDLTDDEKILLKEAKAESKNI